MGKLLFLATSFILSNKTLQVPVLVINTYLAIDALWWCTMILKNHFSKKSISVYGIVNTLKRILIVNLSLNILNLATGRDAENPII